MALRDDLQATLGEAYTLERELGAGGMARVFVATERDLQRKVVVKVLPPDMIAGVSVERFRREIMLVARLQHPHIVPVLGAGATSDPIWYSMPYVQGHSLRERLSGSGELSVAEAAPILRDVADALAYAHRNGVVHRDVKPENILLGEGHALVTDFGVSKALSESANDTRALTMTGVTLGTPAYLSPEQANAEPDVDHRADIYAFGVLAYELFAGRPPFDGSSPHQVIAAHLRDLPVPISAVRPALPSALALLVMRCLEKERGRRPQRAEELLDALAPFVASSTTFTAAQPGRLASLNGKRRFWWLLIVAGVALFAMAGVALWRPDRQLQRQRVVVAPFTNETNDERLDDFGRVIAGWVQDALTQSALLDVVDFRAVMSSPDAGSARPIAAGDIRSLAGASGAGLVVHGTVVKLGDSLEIRARVIEPSGTVAVTIPAVRAGIESPMVAINEVAQRAAGALATMLSARVSSALTGTVHVPTYAAYREFSNGMDAFQTGDFIAAAERFQDAITLDSAFLSPRLWLWQSFSNAGRYPELPAADSLFAILSTLEQRRSELSELERAMLEFFLTLRVGEFDRKLAALRKAAEIWPDRWNYTLGLWLLRAGRPAETLRLYQAMDPNTGFLRGWPAYWLVYFFAAMLVEDFDGAMEIAVRARQQYPTLSTTLCYRGVALTAMGRAGEADSLMNAGLSTAESEPGGARGEAWCRRFLARTAANFLAPSQARPILASALRYFELPSRDTAGLRASAGWAAEIALWMGDTTRFVRYYSELPLGDNPGREDLLQRASARALAGDLIGMERLRTAALAMPASPFERGATEYWLARIAVAHGDMDAATRHLSEAHAQGRYADDIFMHPAFRTLRGHPRFEALVER